MADYQLSRRQIECLTWAARGKTYAEIAIILGLAFPTVREHLNTARLKLRAANLTHAVALAIGDGVIAAPSGMTEGWSADAPRAASAS